MSRRPVAASLAASLAARTPVAALALGALVALAPAAASAQRYVEVRRVASDPDLTGSSSFGVATAIDGNELAVGDPSARAVYVFELATGLMQILRPATATDGSTFGAALALRAGVLVVGDPTSGAGSVEIFKRPAPGLSFASRGTLPASGTIASGARFGASVAVTVTRDAATGLPRETLFVGAPGARRVFAASFLGAAMPDLTRALESTVLDFGGVVAACVTATGEPLALAGVSDPSRAEDVRAWNPLGGETPPTIPNPGGVRGFGGALACAGGHALVSAVGADRVYAIEEAPAAGALAFGSPSIFRTAPVTGRGFGAAVGVTLDAARGALGFVSSPTLDVTTGRGEGRVYGFDAAASAAGRAMLVSAGLAPTIELGRSLSVAFEGGRVALGDPAARIAIVFERTLDPTACTDFTARVCGGEPCVDGACCDTACDGPCQECSTGTCRPDPTCAADAGAPVDAGAARDAGSPIDAGAVDAGVSPLDAGAVDAGASPIDGGALDVDAGESADASTPDDDAGSPQPDAATSMDAGPVPVPPTDSFRGGGGCACAVPGTPARGRGGALALSLLALGAAIRRRRRVAR